MKKIGRNIIEFFPYLVFLYFWTVSGFLNALKVKNQPGIIALCLITIPAIICFVVAVINTYKKLPETGRLPSYLPQEEIRNPRFNRKFGVIVFLIFIIAIGISTYFYYTQPTALQIPSNDDPSLWTAPPFEETILFEQMVPEERERLLSEGIPGKDNYTVMIITDLISILVGCLLFIHCYKNFGFWMATCFLLGSFLYTGIAESVCILSGRFIFGGDTQNMLGDMFYGTFWYPKAAFWFIHCPIMICIGWYHVAYTCVWIAWNAFPKMNMYLRAIAGGLIAMNLDIWMDPIATAPENMIWVWGKGDVLELFGIPVWNFWGWFWVITVFAVLWEKLPLMKEKWGLTKGSIYFFLIVVLCDVIVSVIIYLYHIILGGIFAISGIQHVIQFPAGW